MSTKEIAYNIFNQMSEEQLKAFITLFGNRFNIIPEEEPDEWDKIMIKNSREDNEESVPLDKFAEELGFNPNDLRI